MKTEIEIRRALCLLAANHPTVETDEKTHWFTNGMILALDLVLGTPKHADFTEDFLRQIAESQQRNAERN